MTGKHKVYVDGELNATFAHASDARIWFRMQVQECPEFEIRVYDEGDTIVLRHGAMARASYRYAINWLANNDDCYWLGDPHGSPSVASCAVMDIFGVKQDKFCADLRRELAIIFPYHEALK